MRGASSDVDCWLVSDYGYGLIEGEIEETLGDLAQSAPVIADSRYNVKEFARITAVTPNEAEAMNFGRYYLKDETDLLVIGRQMLDILFLECALITRGNEGMIVFERGRKPVQIPVVGSAESVDVSGAGDTVVAAFGLSLASGATPEQAAKIANCAASVVVMKSGTATCSQDELLAAVEKYL
jgi:rfaE bifunctional protein kinase chain/domain